MTSSNATQISYAGQPLVLRALSSAGTMMAAFVATLVVAVVALFAVGYRPYVVVSPSMEPEMPVGALCVVDTRASFEAVSAGDVVGFRTEGGETVTHRVTEVAAEGLVTKGDANAVADGLTTTRQNYVGSVVRVIPGVGSLVMAAKTPIGIAAVALLLLMLLCAGSLVERSMRPAPRRTREDEHVPTGVPAA